MLFIIAGRGLWEVRVVEEGWSAAHVPHQLEVPALELSFPTGSWYPITSEHHQGFGNPSKGELERTHPSACSKEDTGTVQQVGASHCFLDTQSSLLLLPTLGLSSPHHGTAVNVTLLWPSSPACRDSFWACLNVDLATTLFCVA